MLFSSNWHQMVALLCRLWTLITIARAANLLNPPIAFMLKTITTLKLEELPPFFIKFAPKGCFIVPLANLINMKRTANVLNPLVVFRLKNMTTPLQVKILLLSSSSFHKTFVLLCHWWSLIKTVNT